MCRIVNYGLKPVCVQSVQALVAPPLLVDVYCIPGYVHFEQVLVVVEEEALVRVQILNAHESKAHCRVVTALLQS
jgi:D-ribose pyranose/furanose isomerase RbsD